MLQFTSICILININLPKLAKTIFTLLLFSARNITLSKTRPGCTGGGAARGDAGEAADKCEAAS